MKVELHAHVAGDPADRIPHTAEDLIRRAGALGYGALAITPHNAYFDPGPLEPLARQQGLVLLSGIERSIARKHLLLINAPPEAAIVTTFDDLRALKARSRTLVVAPHPFFPIPSAIGSLLDAHADLIDAVEFNAMHVRGVDFNARATAWAAANGKPLVGNCDLHRLDQLGTTWSEVEAPPDADAICDAIRQGRVTVRSSPLGWWQAAGLYVRITIGGLGGQHR